MEQGHSGSARKRPGLGRLLATALAGGLGVFAVAADNAVAPAAITTPPTVSSAKQPSG